MSTPPRPTSTRRLEHPPGMGHGKDQSGAEPPELPTPRERPHPDEDADPGAGGGWGRQSGEAPVRGPKSGRGY